MILTSDGHGLNLCLNTEIEQDISEILSRKTIVAEGQITVQSRPVNSCPVGNSIKTQRLWWKPCHLGLSHTNPASWLGAAGGLGQQLITRPWHQHTCQWSVTPQPAKKSTLWSQRATINHYCTTTSACHWLLEQSKMILVHRHRREETEKSTPVQNVFVGHISCFSLESLLRFLV